MKDWKGTRIVILGAARQGLALARWLVKHEAVVTLSDQRPEAELAAARAALSGLPIRWALGGHPVELLQEADLLCLSGGVPLSLPIVRAALQRGIPLSNDTQIFMEAVPCKTIGITGSAGKTTTTTLVGQMAKEAYGDQAHVGGNLGDPLINHVDEMKSSDLAILEISSFQLEQMSVSPSVASVLNITPNHLDRHGTMEAYTAAKARILEFQSSKEAAVLGRDDPGAWNLRNKVRGKLHSFGFSQMEETAEGTYFNDGMLYLYERRVDIPLLPRDRIQLRGAHNVSNVLAAFAIGHAAGFPIDAMLKAAEEFRGVPHRLEFVGERRGARWYNDSIATAPERTMAAVRAFAEPIVLLLGGRDKDLPWDALADLIHRRVDHVVLFGEAADKIEKAISSERSAQRPFTLERAPHLHEAVIKAAEVAQPGDIVLLSPGGTSFDEFKDFEERGEKFRVWVQKLS
ncbi:MAG TPA: UDP-N-acetylmuramoyl-L-alanine--D-glutamate ligase [Anaerolineales bacterium]|nr:UDP-N-acetylmuramoyl-L-alanine--D-glutamate ligase [Anaerolineales bacterium]